MNRKQRRANRATASEGDLISHYERQIRQLQNSLIEASRTIAAKAAVIQQAEQNGKVTVITSEDFDRDHPVALVPQAQADAEIIAAMEITRFEVSSLERAAVPVYQAMAAIQIAAMCTNGPETRVALQQANSELISAIDNLDTTMRQQQTFTLNESLRAAISLWAEGVRPLVKDYVSSGSRHSSLILEALRGWLKANNQQLASIKQEIADLPKKGPRHHARLDLAGQMLASYPKPMRGNLWQMVERLYADLVKIPESARVDEQRELIPYICTFLDGNFKVNDRAKAGKWVGEMLKRIEDRKQPDSV